MQPTHRSWAYTTEKVLDLAEWKQLHDDLGWKPEHIKHAPSGLVETEAHCSIDGELLGSGFHRSLVLQLPDREVLENRCEAAGFGKQASQLVVMMTLPAAVYFDSYELENLRQLDAAFPKVTVLGKQDLEMCEPSLPPVVYHSKV
jgi:hypothetical protein